MKPRISIITISYNAVDSVESALKSFKEQDYSSKEQVIIDGGSTDGTQTILDQYHDQFGYFVSEQDNGLYDALNKGIIHSLGDIIGILHADDLFYNKKVLSDVAEAFQKNPSWQALYADLNYIKPNGEIHRKWVSGEYKSGLFRKGWMPPHPTFFVKKELFEKFGNYRTDLSQAADYELMLRFIEKHQITVGYLPKVISLMRVGGKSNATLKNRLEANRQDLFAWKLNDLKPPFGFRLIKPLRKIGQFI